VVFYYSRKAARPENLIALGHSSLR